jgi:hypothetical protein
LSIDGEIASVQKPDVVTGAVVIANSTPADMRFMRYILFMMFCIEASSALVACCVWLEIGYTTCPPMHQYIASNVKPTSVAPESAMQDNATIGFAANTDSGNM